MPHTDTLFNELIGSMVMNVKQSNGIVHCTRAASGKSKAHFELAVRHIGSASMPCREYRMLCQIGPKQRLMNRLT